MKKNLIISPSGNFYGSEQVLCDYLEATNAGYTVFVPGKSLLLDKMKKAKTRHRVKSFASRRLPLLYGHIGLLLSTGRAERVYVNEAGHNKFVVLLARLFPGKKFIIHVRIAEDTLPARWKSGVPANLSLVSISDFIARRLPLPSVLVMDPYRFTIRQLRSEKITPGVLTIGVIGRITASKGLLKLVELVEAAWNIAGHRFQFRLFGDSSRKEEDRPIIDRLAASLIVRIEGFVEDKDSIYDNLDCVVHMSEQEPLGRIFFEAIEYGKPFIGFQAAGIGEIGVISGLLELLVMPGEDWKEQFLDRLARVDSDYRTFVNAVKGKKAHCQEIFSINSYVRKINDLISK